MDILRRLSLALLLFLLLIGIGGHLLAPNGGSHHVQSESTCSYHQGFTLPANLQSIRNETKISPAPTQDTTCVLDLVLTIPHPPTF